MSFAVGARAEVKIALDTQPDGTSTGTVDVPTFEASVSEVSAEMGMAASMPCPTLRARYAAAMEKMAQKMVRDLIVALSTESQITVFLNSHDLDEVQRICGRVAILQRGRIRVCDTLKALQASGSGNGVEIVLVDAGRREEAMGLLRAQPAVTDVVSGEAGLSVSLRDPRGAATVAAILEAHGIEVDEVRRSRRSLEDIYLEVVREGEGVD